MPSRTVAPLARQIRAEAISAPASEIDARVFAAQVMAVRQSAISDKSGNRADMARAAVFLEYLDATVLLSASHYGDVGSRPVVPKAGN